MARRNIGRANYIDDGDSYARFSFEVRDFGVENKISFITINVREFREENRLVEIRMIYSWAQLRSFLRSYGDNIDNGEFEIISRFIRQNLPHFPKKSQENPVKYRDKAVGVGDRSLKTRILTGGKGGSKKAPASDPPVPPPRKIRDLSGGAAIRLGSGYYIGLFGDSLREGDA